MASIQFVALVLVLFLLPNEELDVLFGVNPQQVWLVVVFIAGLSFVGYLLVARALEMARMIAMILLDSASVGIALVLLT